MAGNLGKIEHTVGWLLAPGGGLLFNSGFEGNALR